MLAAVRSDVGKVREINEDYTFLSEPYSNGLILAIVGDGMGGHLAGEIASKSAVETVFEQLNPIMTENLNVEKYKEEMEKAISIANQRVYEKSQNNDNYRGMGTTIVVSIVSTEWILLGHIGDSRAYLIDDDKIKQLTLDHSLVNELLINGQITEEEAVSHPQKNILTRALGTDQEVKIDIIMEKWEKSQTLLLCSDGLTNHVSDQTIFEVLLDKKPLEKTLDQLLLLANQAGGNDNISVIIIKHNNL